MTNTEHILKWEEKWDNYCGAHQTGADEENITMFLGVERGFGKDFIRELLASQKQQILDAVEKELRDRKKKELYFGGNSAIAEAYRINGIEETINIIKNL